MSNFKTSILAAALVLTAAASFAAPVTIVNISANASAPNAGHDSGWFPYNPVSVTLAAGNYSIGEIGKAGGGLFDAYAVYADNGTNAAWTEAYWAFSIDGGATAAGTRQSVGRFNTTALALGSYSSLPQLTLTLKDAANVAFYLNDSAFPYFGDDSGGVSLAVSRLGGIDPTATGLPEPVSLSLVGVAILAMGATRRRGQKAE